MPVSTSAAGTVSRMRCSSGVMPGSYARRRALTGRRAGPGNRPSPTQRRGQPAQHGAPLPIVRTQPGEQAQADDGGDGRGVPVPQHRAEQDQRLGQPDRDQQRRAGPAPPARPVPPRPPGHAEHRPAHDAGHQPLGHGDRGRGEPARHRHQVVARHLRGAGQHPGDRGEPRRAGAAGAEEERRQQPGPDGVDQPGQHGPAQEGLAGRRQRAHGQADGDRRRQQAGRRGGRPGTGRRRGGHGVVVAAAAPGTSAVGWT